MRLQERGGALRRRFAPRAKLAREQTNKHGALRGALPLSSRRGHRGALAGQGSARGNHCLLGSGLLTDLTWDRVGLSHCSFAGSLWCVRPARERATGRPAEILVASLYDKKPSSQTRHGRPPYPRPGCTLPTLRVYPDRHYKREPPAASENLGNKVVGYDDAACPPAACSADGMGKGEGLRRFFDFVGDKWS